MAELIAREYLMHEKSWLLPRKGKEWMWITNVKLQAELLGVWEYVNPDLHEEPQIPVVSPLVPPITTGEDAQTHPDLVGPTDQSKARRRIVSSGQELDHQQGDGLANSYFSSSTSLSLG
ncbi:hypothetical protein N7474_002770 [Penicillium riverlandense]|uniref:uncharacterized protein n=1 Tax=Penicillium riverlandense TaxID=1903569 RepID=UPI0025470225|nr:uncharacterized protein N7474_002770 [Penicillium riverlandense]KAJ5825632.1 hypothetical protein N7474_002770 [Penicillium riverlandense]